MNIARRLLIGVGTIGVLGAASLAVGHSASALGMSDTAAYTSQVAVSSMTNTNDASNNARVTEATTGESTDPANYIPDIPEGISQSEMADAVTDVKKQNERRLRPQIQK